MASNLDNEQEEWWTSENENNGKKLRKLLTRWERREYEIFHETYSKDPKKLYLELNKHRKAIKKMRNKGQIFKGEFFKIFPKGNAKETNSKAFDSPLLTKLIANFCGLTPPKSGWKTLPSDTDQSREAQIVRLTIGRNLIQHNTGYVPDDEYKNISTMMINAMVALGVDEGEFENLLPSIKHGVLPPVSNFTGREKEIADIDELMSRGNMEKIRIVIHAMPGLGKSELTRQFCQKHSKLDNNVLWIDASSQDSMEKAFKDIAEINKLSVKDEKGNFKDNSAIIHGVHKFFRTEKILFVFDDATSMKSIIKFLPNYKPSWTLITTQNTNWTEPDFHKYELYKLTSADTIKFIKDNLSVPLTDGQIEEIMPNLEGHPLALQQFVSFINETMMDIDEYIQLFKTQTAIVLKSELSTIYGNRSAINTIQLATNKLCSNKKFKLADSMINVMSYMYGEEISFNVLKMVFSDYTTADVEDAIKHLSSLSLVSKRKIGDNHVITIHSLVQKSLILQQGKHKRVKHLKKLLMKISQQFESAGLEVQHSEFGKEFYKHFVNINNMPEANQVFLKHCNRNINSIQLFLEGKGSFVELVKINQKLLNEHVSKHGRKHKKTLVSMNRLADCYRENGDIGNAIKLIEECFDQFTFIRSITNRYILLSLSNLASCYQDRGDTQKAIKLNEKCLSQRTTVLGIKHADVLTSLSNLASCCRDNGDIERSIRLNVECLKQRKSVLGPTHPYVLLSMSNLASCYQDKGDIKSAVQLNKECLKQRKIVLGLKHPDVFTSMSELASNYQDLGDTENAIKLNEDCLKQRTPVLGPTHPDVFTSMNNLASCYQDKGKIESAIKLNKECLRQQTPVLGETHPNVLTSMGNLASCYLENGEIETTIELNEECLKRRILVLGPAHPKTLRRMSILASSYQDLGDLETAIKLNEECLKQRTTVLGPTHSDVFTSMNNLAACYQDKGDIENSIKLNEECLKQQMSILGPKHPYVLRSLSNLTSCYIDSEFFL